MSSCWNAYISCTMRKFGFFLFLALLAVSCKSKQEEKPVEPETYTYSIGSTDRAIRKTAWKPCSRWFRR